MVICQIMVEPFSLVLKIGDKWKYSFSWIFTHPVMAWFLGPLVPNQELCSKKFSCSNKIWKMTMLQKNLRSNYAPSKNKYDRAPPKIWQMEHGHFSNYGGTLFLSQIPNSFQTQLLLYFLLQPKGQSKSAPGTSFVKDSIKTRQYEVYFVIEFYEPKKRVPP